MNYCYYVDGAASMRQVNGQYLREAGGWAYALVKDDKVIFSLAGHEDKTTNQAMELTAIYEALMHYLTHFYTETECDKVEIYSDSAYCINIYTNWAKGWKANNWTRRGNKPIENLEIIKATWELVEKFSEDFREVSFIKVPGHSTNVHNNYVDRLAVEAKKGLFC